MNNNILFLDEYNIDQIIRYIIRNKLEYKLTAKTDFQRFLCYINLKI